MHAHRLLGLLLVLELRTTNHIKHPECQAPPEAANAQVRLACLVCTQLSARRQQKVEEKPETGIFLQHPEDRISTFPVHMTTTWV